MTEITFTVLGIAQPAGSKRAFSHPTTGRIVVVDDAKGSRSWKDTVAAEAHQTMAGREPLTGPLELGVWIELPRPKGHYGSGRNAGTVRASAPTFPAVKPDATKLLRAIEDACNQVVWRDDAQIVTQIVRKRYTTAQPYIRVRVSAAHPRT